MKLIPNWRRAWRMFSVQALGFIGALQGVLAVVPPERLLRPVPFLPTSTWADAAYYLTLAVAALGALGRLIDQGSITETPK